jgi:hypothetical protein
LEKTIFFYPPPTKSLTVNFLDENHRVMKKNFETEMYVDGNKLPLNNFIQETIGNILTGFSKTLKGLEDAEPDLIEVKIKRLPKPTDADAHIYPVE